MAEDLITMMGRVRERKAFLRVIASRLFVLYVATNMALCAVLFVPWALPRETVSGLMGRWIRTEGGVKFAFGVTLGFIIDRIYFWEPNHCVEVFVCEQAARRVLYP